MPKLSETLGGVTSRDGRTFYKQANPATSTLLSVDISLPYLEHSLPKRGNVNSTQHRIAYRFLSSYFLLYPAVAPGDLLERR